MYGYIIDNDIADKLSREPGSVEEKRLQDGVGVSEENPAKEGPETGMLLLMRRNWNLICMDISSSMVSRTSRIECRVLGQSNYCMMVIVCPCWRMMFWLEKGMFSSSM